MHRSVRREHLGFGPKEAIYIIFSQMEQCRDAAEDIPHDIL